MSRSTRAPLRPKAFRAFHLVQRKTGSSPVASEPSIHSVPSSTASSAPLTSNFLTKARRHGRGASLIHSFSHRSPNHVASVSCSGSHALAVSPVGHSAPGGLLTHVMSWSPCKITVWTSSPPPPPTHPPTTSRLSLVHFI